jgi:pyruvate kinase
MNTKTSIVATLGPASQSVETLRTLIGLGVSVFRLNFSHGTFDTHKTTLDYVNQARRSFPYTVAVMGDLSGPKIRIGQVEADTVLKEGSRVTIAVGDAIGNASAFTTTYADLVKDVRVGQRILLDDGHLVLSVTDKTDAAIQCTVLVGGPLSSRKGINLPDTHLSTPAITEKDWTCVDWAIENGLDYLALSFVQQAEEVRQLKEYLAKKGSSIRIVPKIEKPLGVRNFESILQLSDAVMVARGDLGVEMDLARVPLVQTEITQLCRQAGKPVIIATQVLQSMIENASPTRAEATDISNAVMECADALMLSGETAVGRHPVQAVKALAHICRVSEAFLDVQNTPRPAMAAAPESASLQAIARSVAHMLDEVKAACVAVWADDAEFLRMLSKARVDVPVLSLTSDAVAARQSALFYGVISMEHPAITSYDDWVECVEKIVLDNHLAGPHDKILMIPPLSILSPNTESALILHRIRNGT